MPGYNQTGPLGSGPKTGRKRGYCDPVSAESGRQDLGGPGFGRPGRWGGCPRGGFNARRQFPPGRGHARRWLAEPGDNPGDSAAEINRLKIEAEFIGKVLKATNRRLEALENSAKGTDFTGNR